MPAEQRLIILGSSLTALAIARDAHALGMAPFVVDSHRGIAAYSRWVKCILAPEESARPAVIQQLLATGAGQDYVIATSDAWLNYIVSHRDTLEKACRAVLHAGNTALEICLDKAKFGAWCAAQGLLSPRIWLPSRERRPSDLIPPLLLRPLNTLHSSAVGVRAGLPKAIEVRTEAELDQWLAAFAERQCPAIVSQSLLHESLTQFSAPFVRTPDRLEVFVARKSRPSAEHCTVGSYVELTLEPKVEQLACKVAQALDYFGIGEAEILRVESTGELFLIEVNARPWLQYSLAPASGYDFLGVLVGKQRPMRRVTGGRRWLDLQSDLYAAFSSSVGAVRRGELGLGSYLLSLFQANVYARFDLHDPMPALRRSEQ